MAVGAFVKYGNRLLQGYRANYRQVHVLLFMIFMTKIDVDMP